MRVPIEHGTTSQTLEPDRTWSPHGLFHIDFHMVATAFVISSNTPTPALLRFGVIQRSVVTWCWNCKKMPWTRNSHHVQQMSTIFAFPLKLKKTPGCLLWVPHGSLGHLNTWVLGGQGRPLGWKEIWIKTLTMRRNCPGNRVPVTTLETGQYVVGKSYSGRKCGEFEQLISF